MKGYIGLVGVLLVVALFVGAAAAAPMFGIKSIAANKQAKLVVKALPAPANVINLALNLQKGSDHVELQTDPAFLMMVKVNGKYQWDLDGDTGLKACTQKRYDFAPNNFQQIAFTCDTPSGTISKNVKHDESIVAPFPYSFLLHPRESKDLFSGYSQQGGLPYLKAQLGANFTPDTNLLGLDLNTFGEKIGNKVAYPTLSSKKITFLFVDAKNALTFYSVEGEGWKVTNATSIPIVVTLAAN